MLLPHTRGHLPPVSHRAGEKLPSLQKKSWEDGTPQLQWQWESPGTEPEMRAYNDVASLDSLNLWTSRLSRKTESSIFSISFSHSCSWIWSKVMKAQAWRLEHRHLLCSLWFCLNHNPLKLLPNSYNESLRCLSLLSFLETQYLNAVMHYSTQFLYNMLFSNLHIVCALHTGHLDFFPPIDIILVFSFSCSGLSKRVVYLRIFISISWINVKQFSF